MSDDKKEDKTLLENLKELESKKKKALMAKILNQLKEDAKEVITLKKRCELLLGQVTTNKKEAKSILDWINSLPEMELEDADVKEMQQEIKDDLNETKDKIEKKIQENPLRYYDKTSAFYAGPATTFTNTGGSLTTTLAASGSDMAGAVTCSYSDDGTIAVI